MSVMLWCSSNCMGQPEHHGLEDLQYLATVYQAVRQGKSAHVPRFDTMSWLILQAAY